MAFSPNGKSLASVGLDDDHMICTWEWAKGLKQATSRGHKDKIFVIAYNPVKDGEVFICCVVLCWCCVMLCCVVLCGVEFLFVRVCINNSNAS